MFYFNGRLEDQKLSLVLIQAWFVVLFDPIYLLGLAGVSHFCTTFVICCVDLIKIGSWKLEPT